MADMQIRRKFLGQTACSLSVIAVAGAAATFNPRLARAQGLEFKVLSAADVKVLDALGDTLMPGAAEAGIAHYIDSQLASTSPLLMLNYLDFLMTLSDFYKQGLAALKGAAMATHDGHFGALDAEARDALVGLMAVGEADPWVGPAAPLFYFALRSDVIDVCFGTEAGFASLDVPYLPHISPGTPW